jgi:hypothetical protein
MESLISSFAKVKINKGTGAGGANTNLHGLCFEKLTKFKLEGYTKKVLKKQSNFFIKNLKGKDYAYVSQKGLVDFFKINYNIQLFRHPDEAFIISDDNETIVKILEKKEQHVDGSVETKLWSAVALKREYELMLPGFKIEYAFCLNSFFKDKFENKSKKWEILYQILTENKIQIFYGEDGDYFDKINQWVYNE